MPIIWRGCLLAHSVTEVAPDSVGSVLSFCTTSGYKVWGFATCLHLLVYPSIHGGFIYGAKRIAFRPSTDYWTDSSGSVLILQGRPPKFFVFERPRIDPLKEAPKMCGSGGSLRKEEDPHFAPRWARHDALQRSPPELSDLLRAAEATWGRDQKRPRNRGGRGRVGCLQGKLSL